MLLAGFVVNEQRSQKPLLPPSIFRIKGLGAGDVTQLIGFASGFAVFYFGTLYMQDVLGYSPLRAGLAYLPADAAIALASALTPRLIGRVSIRPVFVAGTLLAAAGVYWLSPIPLRGSYVSDLLPGLVIMSAGFGALLAAAATAANADVPANLAGLAAALFNASGWIGAAVGLAILSAIATARTTHMLAVPAIQPAALDAGFHQALITASIFFLAATLPALRTANTRNKQPAAQRHTARQAPAVDSANHRAGSS